MKFRLDPLSSSGISIVNDTTVITGSSSGGSSGGSGDVTGPASAADGQLAVYDGTTGKIIKTAPAYINDTALWVDNYSGTLEGSSFNAFGRDAASGAHAGDANLYGGYGTAGDVGGGSIYLGPGTGSGAGANGRIILQSAAGQNGVMDMESLTGEHIFTFPDKDGTVAMLSDVVAGSGDVTGPGSSTDNAIARFDGVTGKLLQNTSPTTVADDGTITVNQGGNVISSLHGDTLNLSDGTNQGFVTARTASGELPAGIGVAGNNGFGAFLRGGTTAGDTGALIYFNGTQYYSAAEIAAVASNFGKFLLMKSGGTVAIGNTAASNLLSIGDDLGNVLGGAGGKATTMGNATGNSGFYIGQDQTHNLGYYWNYNATAANASALLFTYGYTNDMHIGAKIIYLNDQASSGGVIVGNATTGGLSVGLSSVTDGQIRSRYLIIANAGIAGEVVMGAIGPSSQAALRFETDVNLYRSAANVLKTDDGFIIGTPGTSAGNAVTVDGTQTLTNKRITKRTGTVASSATPTINTDNIDFYSITAQAADITSFTTNLSGTPTEGQTLWIAITGTASRAITWGASFEASTTPLPTTTSGTDRLDVGFIWNSATNKWRCVAAA